MKFLFLKIDFNYIKNDGEGVMLLLLFGMEFKKMGFYNIIVDFQVCIDSIEKSHVHRHAALQIL